MKKERNSLQGKTYHVIQTESAKLGRFRIILDTVEEDARKYPYSYIDQKASVCVLPIVKDGILLINQYRHSVGSYELEIPGGGIEANEKPEEAAVRELKEETGCYPKELFKLIDYYPSPGSSNEHTYLYAAICEERASEIHLEPLEYIRKVFVTESEMDELVNRGEIKHGMALLSWFYYKASKGW